MNLIEKVLAVDAINPATGGSITTISDLADKIILTLGIIAGAIAVIFLIYSGILYLTAAGNAENAKKGQQGIINAIIGIVIIVAAYTIINVAKGLLSARAG